MRKEVHHENDSFSSFSVFISGCKSTDSSERQRSNSVSSEKLCLASGSLNWNFKYSLIDSTLLDFTLCANHGAVDVSYGGVNRTLRMFLSLTGKCE